VYQLVERTAVLKAIYDDADLLATYREMNFGTVKTDRVTVAAIRAACTLLLDTPDIAGVFYQDLALAVSRLRPRNMLDVGCGMGRLGAEVTGLNSRCVYVGVDLSLSMVKEARDHTERRRHSSEPAESGAMRMSFAVADATVLPFPSRSFDVVIGANLVDRVDHPNLVIKELWRLVSSDGHLVLSDPFHWEDGAPDERFFDFDHVDSLLSNAIRIDHEPRRGIFCVRRRDGDRVIVYLNETAVFRRA
jgi:SAM-dependent methyltransferase